jgi:hypothetical protein
MAASDLAAVMDGLAAAVLGTGLVREAYGYPPGSLAVPACLVDFPSRIELGSTFGRGGDTLELPVLLLASQTFNQASRDALAAYIDGGSDVVGALEGPHPWGTAHVAAAEATTVVFAGITYLALKLTVEVAT